VGEHQSKEVPCCSGYARRLPPKGGEGDLSLKANDACMVGDRVALWKDETRASN